MHISTLLPFLPLALALPNAAPTLQVTDFSAWIGDGDAAHPNWAVFEATSSVDTSRYQCLAMGPKSLYAQFHPCTKLRGGGANDKMWFRLTNNFNEVEIKRLREVGG